MKKKTKRTTRNKEKKEKHSTNCLIIVAQPQFYLQSAECFSFFTCLFRKGGHTKCETAKRADHGKAHTAVKTATHHARKNGDEALCGG